MESPKSVEVLELEMKQMKETINKIDEKKKYGVVGIEIKLI